MKASLKIEYYDGAAEFVDYEFSEDQIRILRGYCDDAWRLRTSPIFGEKAANKFTINWSQEKGLSFIGDPIDEDAWAAGMHRLRPLLLSDEPTSFYNVASLIGRQLDNGGVRAELKRLRQKFRGELMPSIMTLHNIDGKHSMEEVFDMWINAFEHHRDLEKKEFFSGFGELITDFHMRHLINAHAVEKLRAIMGLFKLIIDVCGDRVKPKGLLELEQKRRVSDPAYGGASNG
ncbi:hypothetical protein [Hyphococcus sp.]|uniref:hypothetical protein n=1 Tax=Hyphococcus sp. TaxID=2038636 RepID=UPI0035C75AFA